MKLKQNRQYVCGVGSLYSSFILMEYQKSKIGLRFEPHRIQTQSLIRRLNETSWKDIENGNIAIISGLIEPYEGVIMNNDDDHDDHDDMSSNQDKIPIEAPQSKKAYYTTDFVYDNEKPNNKKPLVVNNNANNPIIIEATKFKPPQQTTNFPSLSSSSSSLQSGFELPQPDFTLKSYPYPAGFHVSHNNRPVSVIVKPKPTTTTQVLSQNLDSPPPIYISNNNKNTKLYSDDIKNLEIPLIPSSKSPSNHGSKTDDSQQLMDDDSIDTMTGPKITTHKMNELSIHPTIPPTPPVVMLETSFHTTPNVNFISHNNNPLTTFLIKLKNHTKTPVILTTPTNVNISPEILMKTERPIQPLNDVTETPYVSDTSSTILTTNGKSMNEENTPQIIYGDQPGGYWTMNSQHLIPMHGKKPFIVKNLPNVPDDDNFKDLGNPPLTIDQDPSTILLNYGKVLRPKPTFHTYGESTVYPFKETKSHTFNADSPIYIRTNPSGYKYIPKNLENSNNDTDTSSLDDDYVPPTTIYFAKPTSMVHQFPQDNNDKIPTLPPFNTDHGYPLFFRGVEPISKEKYSKVNEVIEKPKTTTTNINILGKFFFTNRENNIYKTTNDLLVTTPSSIPQQQDEEINRIFPTPLINKAFIFNEPSENRKLYMKSGIPVNIDENQQSEVPQMNQNNLMTTMETDGMSFKNKVKIPPLDDAMMTWNSKSSSQGSSDHDDDMVNDEPLNSYTETYVVMPLLKHINDLLYSYTNRFVTSFKKINFDSKPILWFTNSDNLKSSDDEKLPDEITKLLHRPHLLKQNDENHYIWVTVNYKLKELHKNQMKDLDHFKKVMVIKSINGSQELTKEQKNKKEELFLKLLQKLIEMKYNLSKDDQKVNSRYPNNMNLKTYNGNQNDDIHGSFRKFGSNIYIPVNSDENQQSEVPQMDQDNLMTTMETDEMSFKNKIKTPPLDDTMMHWKSKPSSQGSSDHDNDMPNDNPDTVYLDTKMTGSIIHYWKDIFNIYKKQIIPSLIKLNEKSKPMVWLTNIDTLKRPDNDEQPDVISHLMYRPKVEKQNDENHYIWITNDFKIKELYKGRVKHLDQVRKVLVMKSINPPTDLTRGQENIQDDSFMNLFYKLIEMRYNLSEDEQKMNIKYPHYMNVEENGSGYRSFRKFGSNFLNSLKKFLS